MASLKYMLIAFTVFALSACGGSDSSDGGGNEINFTGTETIRLLATGVNESISLDITINITNTNVTITDSDGFEFKGSLNGNALTASGIIVLGNLGEGIVCVDLPLGYKGTVSGSEVNGTIGGSLSCTLDNIEVPLNVSGTFTASSAAVARQRTNESASIVGSIRSLVH